MPPSLHPPGGAAVPAPAAPLSACGWGGSHRRCLVLPRRPPSPAPPPPVRTQLVCSEKPAGLLLLNRWISHVFGHFRPNRRKLPKWWRNLTTLSERRAEIAEPAAELAEEMKGRRAETRGRRLLAPEPTGNRQSFPSVPRRKSPKLARTRTVTTRPLPAPRRGIGRRSEGGALSL